MKKIGNQTPTKSVVLPYTETQGIEAVEIYNCSGRTAQEWQEQLVYDILAVDDEELYVHSKFGYSVPRRNGKGEILTIVEMDGLERGRKILHTAHRTTTSSAASKRLAALLKDRGYTEVARIKPGETYENAYVYAKQYGLESITLLDTGGVVYFRTRTSSGGLGEGFDTLIVDEAQEYTDDQQNTLQYTVSDSENPQIILCGTPPTSVSKGTVFPKLRKACLSGQTEYTGWAEWSVDSMSDVNDRDLWWLCNPAMGYQLNERKVNAEDKTDEVDFNIQRLGLWIQYNQASAITQIEWRNLEVDKVPPLKDDLFAGIKFGSNGLNAVLSVAVKTKDGRIFAECIDCQSLRNGNGWIIDYLKKMKPRAVYIDGQNGQESLVNDMKDAKIKKAILPTVKQIISASALFEQHVFGGTLCHMNQPSVEQIVSNCEHRAIGSSGGFGYRSLNSQMEVAIIESMMLAVYACDITKERVKQKVIC